MEIPKWSIRIKVDLEKHKDSVSERNWAFYNVEKLQRAAIFCEKFAPECPKCESLKEVMDDMSQNLHNYLNVNNAGRQAYDDKFALITRHLGRAHGLYPKGYFQSFYAFLGLAAGGLAGFAVHYMLSTGLGVAMAVALAGIIIGRYAGAVKDKNVAKDQLFL